MNARKLWLVAIAAGSLALGGFASAQEKAPPAIDPSTPIVTMGNQKITAGDFDGFLSVLPPETQNAARGEGKRQAVDELIKLRLLAAEARAKGLDKTAKYQQQLQLMQDNILVGLLLSDIQDSLVTPAEVQKYYDEHKADFERVTARHILLLTRGENALTDAQAKAKAEAIKKRIDAGEDFATIAKAESGDPGSKRDGGLLPPFGHGEMVPEFEKKAFELKVGEVSEPVKTDFGYHIIKLESKNVASFDQVKEHINNTLRQEKFQKMVDDLRAKAAPKYDEAFFGPAPKPAGEAGLTAPTK